MDTVSPGLACRRGAADGTGNISTGGGGGAHLTDAARCLIIERVIAGDTNAHINSALRTARHIGPRDSVSKQTLTRYRRMYECRVDIRRLPVEALQVGHGALSDLVLRHSEIVERTAAVLFPDGRFVTAATPRHALAARLFMFSSEFLWEVLWAGGTLSESIKDEEKIREAARQAETLEEVSDAQRAVITREVKQLLFTLLTDMVRKKREIDEEARRQAEGTAEAAATPETTG